MAGGVRAWGGGASAGPGGPPFWRRPRRCGDVCLCAELLPAARAGQGAFGQQTQGLDLGGPLWSRELDTMALGVSSDSDSVILRSTSF